MQATAQINRMSVNVGVNKENLSIQVNHHGNNVISATKRFICFIGAPPMACVLITKKRKIAMPIKTSMFMHRNA